MSSSRVTECYDTFLITLSLFQGLFKQLFMSVLSPVDEQLPEPARQALAVMGIDWNRCKSYPDQAIGGVGKDSPIHKLSQHSNRLKYAAVTSLTQKNPQALGSAGFVHFSGQSMHRPLIVYSRNASPDLLKIGKSGFT